MRTALRIVLTVFGAICAIIAVAHIAIGPRAIPGGVVTNATMDSEDRFYATLFLGFALTVIWSARDLDSRDHVIKVLLAVFFAGGMARIISLAMVGPPNALFLFLGALDCSFPQSSGIG